MIDEYLYNDWIDDPNEYECIVCGSNKTEISGSGKFGIKVKCKDHTCDGWHKESGFMKRLFQRDECVFKPPDEWVIGDPEEFRYQCPHCDGYDIETIAYGDGYEQYDVCVRCTNCDEQTWE